MSGILVAPTFASMSNLRDVNNAAIADNYGLTWDAASSKHIYEAIVTPSATDASSYGFVVDEDNLASDLDTKIPTQQSVKAYVDAAISGLTYLQSTDIDTLAEINAILGDATLVTVEATDASGYGWVIDEDNLASDSATKVPTQQSVKAYVDAISTGDTLPVADTTGIAKGSADATKIVRLEVDGVTSATTRVLTVQDADGTIALSGDNIDATQVTSGVLGDATISETSVTQHEAALSITESQISDLGTYSTTGHAHAASDITSGTLTHERGGIEADISAVAIGDVLAGTGTGTIGIVAATGASDGDVLTVQADGTVDFETPTASSDTSGDGTSWSTQSATEANGWRGLAYGKGLFVAVSDDGTNRVMMSTDGINWSAQSAAEANAWNGVTYGNDLFVAVASDGTNRVMTSPDGTTWTARSAAEANNWIFATYGNGLFVAVSTSGTNRVMTSPDGTTWTARAAAEANSWTSVTYGNDLFVAVSSTGTNRVMTSPDGTTWTARSAAEANAWRAVTYANGLFVAVSSDGTNRVMTSPDGTTWTARSAAEANAWYGLTYGNGLFVAVSYDGTNRVMTSPDGTTWTARSAAESNQWFSATYGNGLFVAVADSGTNRVQTSGKQQERILI